MILPGDWYALGQIFCDPFRFTTESGRETLGVQVLSVMDVGSGQILGGGPIEKEPGPFTAAEIRDFLGELFSQCGVPRVGIVISNSVWQSGHEMLFDEETAERGEILEHLGIEIGPMQQRDMDAIAEHLTENGLRVLYDADDL